MKDKDIRIYERIYNDVVEHHHEVYDYWHPACRMHKPCEIDLPPSHIRDISEKGHIFHCFDITTEDIREVAKIKGLILEDEYLYEIESYIKKKILLAIKSRYEIIEQAIIQSMNMHD